MNNSLQTTEVYKEELEKNFIVGLAKTAAEKQEIYAFRYHVYVEEMSRKLNLTEKEDGLLYDEMDDWGYLIYIKAGLQIVGTARVNIGEIEKFPPELITQLSLNRFQKFYEGKEDRNFALSTKVAVAPNYRNSQVFYLIISKTYELYCEHRVQFSFGGCNMYLIRLYEEVGLRRFGKNFADPGYGLLTPIVWLVDDIEHVKKLHSPVYRLARKRQGLNKQVADWFVKEFPETINIINSRLTTKEEFWRSLSALVGNSPEKVMPILQGLSETEAMKFLHECGLIAQCYAGDRITTSGDPSNELNILLSGELQIANAGPAANNRIYPGQHFGAVGLVDHTIHTQDIVATTTTDILVLSRICFPKFQRRYPAIAHQVLNNLSHMTDIRRDNDAK